MIAKLIPLKLKGFISLASVATCGASVAASSTTISTDTRNCLDETVNTATTQITSIANQTYESYLKASYDNFKTKYEDVKEDAKKTFTKDNAKKIPDKYKELGGKVYALFKKDESDDGKGGDQSQDSSSFRDKAEYINYLVFHYAKIVKAILEKIGPLLEGTVKTAAGNESSAGKISIQKIQEIYQSEKLSGVASGFLGSYATHKEKMEKITGKDIGDGIKILFSPESGKMNEILTKIQTNLTQLMSKNSTDFKTSEELIKFIFMGDNADQTIKDSASTAKDTVSEENVKTLLKDIGIEDSNIAELTKVLESISGTQAPAAPPAS